jgi:hypothetical protein
MDGHMGQGPRPHAGGGNELRGCGFPVIQRPACEVLTTQVRICWPYCLSGSAGIGPRVEDAVTKYEKVRAQHDGHRREIDGLSRNPEGGRQQRCRGRGHTVLHGGGCQVSTDLMTKRQRELLVMGPHERSLKREMDNETDTEADRKSRLKGNSEGLGKQDRGGEIDERHRAPPTRRSAPLDPASQNPASAPCARVAAPRRPVIRALALDQARGER